MPHGPAHKPPSYDGVNSCSTTKRGISDAMAQWYWLARGEWAHLTCTKSRYKKAKFSWQNAVGNRKACEGSTALALAWRRCARRAEDVARIRARVDVTAATQNKRAVESHAAAIAGACAALPPGIPPLLKDEIQR